MPRTEPVVVLLASIAIAACTPQLSGTSPGSGDRIDGSSWPGRDGGGGTIDEFADAIYPDAEVCEAISAESEPQPAHVLFLVDVSGSMNCRPDQSPTTSMTCHMAPQSGSRWEIFHTVLSDVLATLPDDTGAGLMHFPDGDDWTGTNCVPSAPDVALGPLSATLTAINSSLRAIVPVGPTTTHDAVSAAFDELAAATVDGNKFLVLATDGEANYCLGCRQCGFPGQIESDNQNLITRVRNAAGDGIRTFVIGSPGSESFRAVLSLLAEAGDTAEPGCSSGDPRTSSSVGNCHQDMTVAADFQDALTQALEDITGSVLGCVYDIPPNPNGDFDPEQVNVAITTGAGDVIEVPRDPSRQNGWDYSDDETQIILYGDACDTARTAVGGKIDIQFGCPTIIVQ